MKDLEEIELTLVHGLTKEFPQLKSHIPFLRVSERIITGVGMYVNFVYEGCDENFEAINVFYSGQENIAIKSLSLGL
jgi:hypothetical protein